MARKTTPKTLGVTKVKPRQTVPVKAKPAVAEPAPTPKVIQKKSVFSAGTLITVLLLIALLELAFYFKREKEKKIIAESTPIVQAATIFSPSDGSVSSIEIKPTEGDTVKVARDAKNVWALELPATAEVNQGLAEAAATQISALQVVSPIKAGADPEIFGLKTPAFVITIEFSGGNTHTLEVGSATPTNSGYYVRLDKDKIMIADLNGIESLLQLAAFPPYLNTPTPPPVSSTPTPAPVTEATQTPTP
jgi:hypothetical protein